MIAQISRAIPNRRQKNNFFAACKEGIPEQKNEWRKKAIFFLMLMFFLETLSFHPMSTKLFGFFGSNAVKQTVAAVHTVSVPLRKVGEKLVPPDSIQQVCAKPIKNISAFFSYTLPSFAKSMAHVIASTKTAHFATATLPEETGRLVAEWQNRRLFVRWKQEVQQAEELRLAEEARRAEEARLAAEAQKKREEASLLAQTNAKQTVFTMQEGQFVYYNQKDARWSETVYGEGDIIGIYGCGPTALAALVSSLTDDRIEPPEMARWAYENGYFSKGSGSYHNLIPNGAMQFGLSASPMGMPNAEAVLEELRAGKLVVALMARGHFTQAGHFIILRGLTEDGQVLLADPANLEYSTKPWDLDIILEESKQSADAGGPFWSIGRIVPSSK